MRKILKNTTNKFIISSILALSFVFGIVNTVQAQAPDLTIQDKSYSAEYISQSEQDPIKIKSGETKTIDIKFKNTGNTTWRPGSSRFISAYTVDPKYRKSKFATKQWQSKKQTAKIDETVAPGEVGTLSIQLKAPTKPGTYKEKFFLAAEDHTWVQNGYFYLELHVELPERTPSKKEQKVSDPKPKISDPGLYQAQFISQSISDPITIEAGSKKDVTVKFKNKGQSSWSRSGPGYVSIYTMKPKYNESEFFSSSWISKKQPAKIKQTTQPGDIGEFSFSLSAPEVTGEYIEHFYLAAEDTSWIQDGYFYLKIKAVSPRDHKTNQNNNADKQQANRENAQLASSQKEAKSSSLDQSKQKDKNKQLRPKPQAEKVLINQSKIAKPGGNKFRIITAILNSSDTEWDGYTIKALNTSTNFSNNSWVSKQKILTKDKQVSSEGIAREIFFARTPPQAGDYKFKFAFFSQGEKIPGTTFELPIEVTKSASSNYSPPFESSSNKEKKKDFRMKQQPKVRIGLKAVDNNYTLVTPVNSKYKVYAGEVIKGEVQPGETVTLSKEDDGYFFGMDGLKFETDKYLRLVPQDNYSAKFKLSHFTRKVEWREKNFNIYRGAIEYRKEKSGEKDKYLINELKLEDYTKGLAETSENPPLAMQKAQAVAARTYAMHIRDTSKHTSRNFHLSGGTGDQLYLGVKSEKLSPNYVKAAKATRGYMITYNDEIVVTPYFGHSNGYTRSWADVWEGDQKPWLVPVRTEYDSGLSTYGHGVGMSQRDAAIRARKEDASWKELIYHYYTDIELEQFYN